MEKGGRSSGREARVGFFSANRVRGQKSQNYHMNISTPKTFSLPQSAGVRTDGADVNIWIAFTFRELFSGKFK